MPIVSTNEKGVNYWFVVMGSDGAESLGKLSMLHDINILWWVIMTSVMASDIPDSLFKPSIKPNCSLLYSYTVGFNSLWCYGLVVC